MNFWPKYENSNKKQRNLVNITRKATHFVEITKICGLGFISKENRDIILSIDAAFIKLTSDNDKRTERTGKLKSLHANHEERK